jgi:hypothetical protein
MSRKDCNIYFKESAQGWVLEVFAGFNPHEQYGSEWTNVGCFSDKKSAQEWYRDHYVT